MSSPACAAAIAGFLIACRLSGAGPGTGLNLEILALTAAVVGGNSLGGGRGSIAKGLMGAIIVLVMTNGLIRLGYGTGTNQMVLGIMLAAAVTIDIRWLKNRHKVLERGLCRAGLSRDGRDRVRPARLRHQLRARQPPVAGRADRARRAGRAGGRHPRPRRPPLLRHAPWRDRPLLRAGLPALGGLCPYRRLSARPCLRPRRQSDQLRRRHGALFDRARPQRDQTLGRDASLLDLDRRRCAAARPQRLRHRAGRPHLLHRFHQALRRP